LIRFYLSLTGAAILALLVLSACNSAEQKPTVAAKPPVTNTSPLPNPDSVRRITTVELQDLLAKNQAIVVDVRGDAAYKSAHIKGAISIPAQQVLQHLDEFPRDKLIVTYCS
jgi:3-mercaptopyruvate sulfurtransferase SseA